MQDCLLGFLLLVIFCLAFLACCELGQISGGAAVLNLLPLLGQDLLPEISSGKLALGETLWIGVTGGSQPHKKAALAVAEPKEER